MKWFEGNASSAIQLAKIQKTLFIVFIADNEEASTETTKAWDNDTVSQLSLTNNCIGLKLDAKSQAGVQFAQIYPVMVLPSIFFIAPETGLPLEVCVGQVDSEQLLEKFNKALQMHHSPASSSSPPPESAANPAASQPSIAGDEAAGATGGSDVMEVAEDKASPSHGEAAEDEASPSNDEVGIDAAVDDDDDTEDVVAGETLEERKERLLQRMTERRKVKAKEEEENDRKKEVERRKLGQETQKFQQWKTEMEKKELANSYKKEKEEQRKALEKVRADLERDRQERAMKYKQEKDLQEEAREQAKKAKLEADAKKLEKENALKRESCRIQFRLPDGSSVMQVFAATEPLSAARTFIQQRLSNKPVTLSTTFPKRTFVESDMSQTLLDLELVPSSVLIVLPGTSTGPARVTAPDSDSTSFLWILLAPLLALWNFICTFLFPPAVHRHVEQNVDRTENRQPSSPATPGSSDRQQEPRSQGLRSRKVGNVNRLTAEDEDDDSATWNGNSTQQM